MKRLLLYIHLISFILAGTAGYGAEPRGSVKGEVLDMRTLEPLVGVNIRIEGTTMGGSTDATGLYAIERIPVGVYNLRVQYLGYETLILTDIVIRSERSTLVNIKLNEQVITGQEVTVTAGYFQRDRQQPVSRVRISPEEMRRSPGSGQELSRVLSALPGVAAVGDVSQDLMVRGGSPNENAFYIDNILMPGVNHFSMPGGGSNGPIGIVNTDLIADVQFSAGGYPAGYGDRLSSVTEITYREGNRNGFKGDALFSMGGMGLNAEGGLPGKKGSYLVSFRRSYLDLIADAINQPGAPQYNDIQGKVTYDLNNRNKLSVLGVFGSSLFTSTVDDAIENGLPTYFKTLNEQGTIGVTHRAIWRGSGYTLTSVSVSQKRDNTTGKFVSDATVSDRFDIVNSIVGFRTVSRYVLSDRVDVEIGAEGQIEHHAYDYFIAAGINQAGAPRPAFVRDLTISGTQAAFFSSVNLSVTPKWSHTAGIRAGYTEYNGRVDVAPRYSSSYQINDRFSLNMAAGVYYQSLPRYLLSQSASNRKLKNMRALHLIAGSEYLITPDTRLSIEYFDKQYDRIPVYPAGTTGVLPLYIPDDFTGTHSNLTSSGTAWARGVEMLVQKKLATDFYGMISSTYFRTKYRSHDGNWYNRNFDNRFLFSLIGGYRPGNTYEFSARWTYMGGRPVTPIDETLSVLAGEEVRDITRFQGDRMAPYHALYVRADRRYFFRNSSMVTFIEIWNAYARTNTAGSYWSNSKQEITEVPQFGFIPVGGVKVEW